MRQRTKEEREAREKEQLACVPHAMTALSLVISTYSLHDILVMMESIAEGFVDDAQSEDRKESWGYCVEDVKAALEAVRDLQAIRYADIDTE